MREVNFCKHGVPIVSHINCPQCDGNGVEGLAAEIHILKSDYFELIYAVASKYPGETRHQTALRYIMEAGRGSNQAGKGCSKDVS